MEGDDGTRWDNVAASQTLALTYGTGLDAVPDLLNGTLDFWMTNTVAGLEAILEGKALQFSGKPPLLRGPRHGCEEGRERLAGAPELHREAIAHVSRWIRPVAGPLASAPSRRRSQASEATKAVG